MGVEVRWFFEGRLPAQVSARFGSEALGEFLPATEQRTDLYLATREELGVKLRDGKLEIKWRPDPNQPLTVSSLLQGQAEYWDKRSWKDPQAKGDGHP